MKLKNELDFLLNQADIGIYNKCEVIEIFGVNKKRKEAFNIYTLIVFENTKQNNKKESLIDELQTFKGIKNINWGIQKRVIDVSVAKKLYIELLEKNIFKIDKPLKIGKLKFLPKQYVAPEESNVAKPIQINKILKNNFHNGSYILEFFDEEKSNTKFILDNPSLLNKFSEQVSSILPIRIGTLSDRLGNIIFQFPINILEVYHKSIIDENRKDDRFKGFQIEIYSKSDTLNIQNLFIRTYEENETITRHKLKNVEDKITKIYLDDSFETYIEIINKENELLLYRFKVYLIKQGYISSNIVNSQKRVFTINDEIEDIEVSHNINNIKYGKSEENKLFNEWIYDRKYKEELKELERKKIFIQYFGNQEEEALGDIRELIKKYGENGVYLWDPYLDAIDIKNTLYYSKTAYVPLKAITGLKQNDGKQKAKEKMIEEFNKDDKKYLFLDLEVRGKFGSNGYDFHDRFLIFPLERPRAWSLGISVNKLGKSHHIIQEVQHPQHILDEFNKLWLKLDKEECLIWKSN